MLITVKNNFVNLSVSIISNQKLSILLIAFNTFQIDELLKRVPHSTGVGFKQIIVLRLPTKHCFLNPIELVWAYVKGYVARRNSTCKQADVLKLTREAIENVSSKFSMFQINSITYK